MTTKEHTKKRRPALAAAIVACFICTFLTPQDPPDAVAQALLYDNTDHTRFDDQGRERMRWAWSDGSVEYLDSPWYTAAPFNIGDHDNIASVSIPLGRGRNAKLTGTVRFSLWDDNGRGFPGQEVGELGILDPASLEEICVPTCAHGGDEIDSLPSLVTFDSPIGDLVRGENYFVVIDHHGMESFDGDYVLGVSKSPIGSSRSGVLGTVKRNPPFRDSDWDRLNFNGHTLFQMRVTSADEPYAPIVSPVGTTYHQDFITLGDDGQMTTFMPQGWAFSDSARTKSFDGRDFTGEERVLAVDERFFATSITEAFPAGSSLGQGTPIFNAGLPGDPDRALALGVTRTTEDGMLQLVAEVAGGDANSIQLAFDVEAWDTANSRDLPGEAGFNVALDIDTGDGFVELLDLGTVTTGATLLPAAVGDFTNGNGAANRVSYDSGLRDVDVPEGSLLRVRWMADTEAQTQGWVYGLDNVSLGMFGEPVIAPLQAGDADQDLDFDQLDLVQVQVAAKYLTGQTATWGEGDWDGAQGGSPGNPPASDGLFNQFDIIAAQLGAKYLTGPYAAVQAGGTIGDGQTSVIYNTGTGEIAVDAPAGVELTSINIDSAASIFTGQAAANLGGSFDNDADANIFKATFGSSFASLSFGNVAQTGLSQEFVLNDLTVIGSLAGGGDLGSVDLVYVPEPTSVLLLSVGLAVGLVHFRRVNR